MWNAWNWLQRRRDVSTVPKPIPLVEITTYLDEQLYTDPNIRQFMISCIDILDDEWVAHTRGNLGNS